jgi:hypothetical protein
MGIPRLFQTPFFELGFSRDAILAPAAFPIILFGHLLEMDDLALSWPFRQRLAGQPGRQGVVFPGESRLNEKHSFGVQDSLAGFYPLVRRILCSGNSVQILQDDIRIIR